MSWDISIVDENDNIMSCATSHKLRGGRVRTDVTLNQIDIMEAELNITYNYSKHYNTVWEDYDGLYDMFNDKKAKDCIDQLKEAVDKLGTETSENYWEATSGNAGKSAESLLWLCEQCPEGTVKIC